MTNINKTLLHKLYIKQQKSTYRIGKLLGCSPMQIYKLLRQFDIRIRSRSEAATGARNARFKPILEAYLTRRENGKWKR